MMHNYYEPDCWVLVKIPSGDYKVLGGWFGGYLDSDYWRLNSGVKSVTEEDDAFLFNGYSGSVYCCKKSREEVRRPILNTLNYLEKNGCTRVDAKDLK